MSDRAEQPRAVVLRIGDQAFPIEPDRIHVIGSGPRADVRVEATDVAAAHATFCTHDGRLIVEDLGADAGTWVGPVRIRGECEVPVGTVLRFGSVECRVEIATPPAPPPPRGRIAGRADVPLRHGDPAFRDLMAEELRRAPWFALSLTLHALLFLVLWLLVPQARFGTREPPHVAFGSETTPPQIDAASTATPEAPELDVAPPDPLPLLADTTEEVFEPPDEPLPSTEPATAPSRLADALRSGGDLLRTPIPAGGRDILADSGAGRLSDGFRRTVAGLRESGLEIVFVVDSTGSMGPVLDGARQRMVRMLEALRSLVPDARVGVTTYRDRGPREEYLVRQLPLGADFYRTLNFVQGLQAGGGGDRPEAVLDGLAAAIQMPWRQGAHRVIVLIGDAPAHADSKNDLQRQVRAFVADGRSAVHAIMTAPDVFGGIERDTVTSFALIADAGRGLSVPFEREDRILDQVLTLAIGAEHRDAVAEVFDALERDRRAAAAQPAPDPDRIRRELRKPRLDDRFVEAIAADRSLETAEALIRALASREIPPAGRHAASWALQRILRLRAPPLEPGEDGPIRAEAAETLRIRALTLAERAELTAPEEGREARRSPAPEGRRSAAEAPNPVRDPRRD